MTHKRLFLEDLTDEHLTLLHRAAILTPDGKTACDWIAEIAEGTLALFEIPGGVIGLKREPKQIFIELLAGKSLDGNGVRETVLQLANGSPVEGFVVNPAAVRLYKRFGFKPVGMYMRFENAEST